MDKYNNDAIFEQVKKLITTILESDMYQQYLLVEEKMKRNSTIMEQIQQVKQLEKKYVRSGFQEEALKEQIDTIYQQLKNNPLYRNYEQSFDKVNELFTFLKEDLNDYFQKISQ